MSLLDEMETLTKLMRQLPEVEAEAERCQEALNNALENVCYVKDGIEELRQRVCNLLMPPNIVVEGPQAPPLPLEAVRTVTPATVEEVGDQMFAGVPAWANECWRDDETLRSFVKEEGAIFHDGKPLDLPGDAIVDVHFSGDLSRKTRVDDWDWTDFECAYLLRSTHPAVEEKGRDQSLTHNLTNLANRVEDAVRAIPDPGPEIPEGFTRWEEGAPMNPDATVDVIYRNGARPYKLTGAVANALDWTTTNWKPNGDAWDIIAYRILEPAQEAEPAPDAAMPEMDGVETAASVLFDAQTCEPVDPDLRAFQDDQIVEAPVRNLWQEGYDDKLQGYQPRLGEPEYLQGYNARAEIEKAMAEDAEADGVRETEGAC